MSGVDHQVGRVRSGRADKYLSAWANIALPVSTLLATPLLLDRLGAAGLALVYVALAISRISASLDLGLGGLAIPRSAELLRRGTGPVWAYLRDALRHLSAVTGLVVVAAVAAVALGLRLLDADAGTSLALLVGAAVAALSLQLFNLVNGVLYAASAFGALALFATAGSTIYLLAILVWVGAGDVTLVLVITAVQYLVVAVLGVGYVRWRRPTVAAEGADAVSSTGIISWRMQLIALGGVVIWQAPTLVASAVLAPVAVTAVGIGQQYASVVRVAGLSFAGYFLSRIALAGDHSAMRRKALALNRRWLLLCAGGVGLAAGGAPVVVPIWLGDVPAGSVGGSILAAVASAAIISSLVGTCYLRSIGRLRPEFNFVVVLLGSTVVAVPVALRFETPTSVWAAFAGCYTLVGLAYATWAHLLLSDRLERR